MNYYNVTVKNNDSQWSSTNQITTGLFPISFTQSFQGVDFVYHTSYMNWYQNSISFNNNEIYFHTSTPETGRPYTYLGYIMIGI